MFRAVFRRYSAPITPLSRRGLNSAASPAEENENVQNMAKLLSAVRQYYRSILLLFNSSFEDDVLQVIGPPGANREYTLVLSKRGSNRRISGWYGLGLTSSGPMLF